MPHRMFHHSRVSRGRAGHVERRDCGNRLGDEVDLKQ